VRPLRGPAGGGGLVEQLVGLVEQLVGLVE